MPTNPSQAGARLAFLQELLRQDPGNMALLGETADAAVAAGELDAAEQLVSRGADHEPGSSAWRFRMANVRLAQGRLDQARDILLKLEAGMGRHAAISHNLAFIAFRQGAAQEAVSVLEPWMRASNPMQAAGDSTQALWLRALHRAGRLDDAWAWLAVRSQDGLPPEVAAVASLIAFDLDKLAEAERWSALAHSHGIAAAEAELANAGVLMARGEVDRAVPRLEGLLQREPHQARGWSTLGYALLLRADAAGSRAAFGRALALDPDEPGALLGMGWACMLGGDAEASAHAFGRAAAVDASSADAQGGLAIVAAARGDVAEARRRADAARSLQPGSMAARFAESMITGDATRLHRADEIARRWLAERHKAPPKR